LYNNLSKTNVRKKKKKLQNNEDKNKKNDINRIKCKVINISSVNNKK
jgi:hypothetical protein